MKIGMWIAIIAIFVGIILGNIFSYIELWTHYGIALNVRIVVSVLIALVDGLVLALMGTLIEEVTY